MSEENYIVRVFNTFTGMYEDVEVSEEVYLELIRDKWRNEKRQAIINEREISVNELCDEDAYREEDYWQFADVKKGPKEMLEDEETYGHLLNVIDQLDPAMRRRFRMFYIESLSVKAIARIEGVHPSRVYDSILCAKKKLKKMLSKKKEGENDD